MVSVITLTYNRASMIEETIRSVLAQEHGGFEYLIADDGSEDDTEEVVRRFTDSRIRYFRLPHTGRISALRNFCIEKAKGEWIAFLDSDDVWEADKTRLQMEALGKNPQAGFVFSDVVLSSGPSTKKMTTSSERFTPSSPQQFFLPMISNRLAIYPSSLMFRKECIHKTGPFNEGMIGGDMDFMTRLAYHFLGLLLPGSPVTVKMHDQNHSSAYVVEAHQECIETLNYFQERRAIGHLLYRKVTAFHHRCMAERYLEQGIPQKAKSHFARSLLLNPAGLKSAAGLFRVLFR